MGLMLHNRCSAKPERKTRSPRQSRNNSKKAGWGLKIMKVKIGPMAFAGGSLGAAALAGVLAAGLTAVPSAARAACDDPESGVPKETLLSSLGLHWAGLQGLPLAKSGISVGATYYGEVLGNPSGGLSQGTHYDGLLDVYMNADLGRVAGWKGLCFHVNGYQIHGTSITAENLGSIVSASDIEAFPSTRLDELWFEQKLLNDKISVRFGELAIDTEFMIADSAGAFIDSTFDWTTLGSDNLPFGGPIYPFASPGVRVSVEPNNHFRLMAGVYEDNPIGPCPENLDPGQCNTNGLDFRLKDPPLLLIEGDYSYNKNAGRPGTIKLGGWRDFGKADDLLRDASGGLLAQTGANPLRHDGNFALYGVIDQMIYRLPGDGDAKGISVFARVIGSPSDRNQIDAYADAGIVFTGMVPRRPDDVFGIGFAYTGVSNNASAFDRESGLSVIRNHETLLEITYTAEIKPGWTLQPDLQYIVNPGGHVPNDTESGAVGNATVLGLRTTINF
jgi:porin